MEPKHRRQLEQRFGRENLPGIRVLDVPDDYVAMDPELIELLEGRMEALLEDLSD